MVKISELLGVEINQKDIFVGHRLPTKKIRDESKKPDPPAIIARFVSRSVRNEIYNNRKLLKHSVNQTFQSKGCKNCMLMKILPELESTYNGELNKWQDRRTLSMFG